MSFAASNPSTTTSATSDPVSPSVSPITMVNASATSDPVPPPVSPITDAEISTNHGTVTFVDEKKNISDAKEVSDNGSVKVDDKLMDMLLSDVEEVSSSVVKPTLPRLKFFIVLEQMNHSKMMQELIYEVSKFHRRKVSVYSFNSILDAQLFLALPYSVPVEIHHLDIGRRVEMLDWNIQINQEEDSLRPDVIFLDQTAVQRNQKFIDALSTGSQFTLLTSVQKQAFDLMNGDTHLITEVVAASVGHSDVGSGECPMVEGAQKVLVELSKEVRNWFINCANSAGQM